jgi:uncharacterized protein YhaN
MSTDQATRDRLILGLDDELLKGGVSLSEWCSLIVKEADQAYSAGAYLPTILTAVAAIETHLRAEYEPETKVGLHRLVENSSLHESLKARVHELRRYRNKWVHVNEPWDDLPLMHEPATFEAELEKMAEFAVRLLREIIYHDQWV